jgi:hypothetical protein
MGVGGGGMRDDPAIAQVFGKMVLAVSVGDSGCWNDGVGYRETAFLGRQVRMTLALSPPVSTKIA